MVGVQPQPKAPQKFVGNPSNDGRLGNQLFHLIIGYGIARKLNRTQYLPLAGSRKHAEKYLAYLHKIFPRLNQTYVLTKKGIKQRKVKFGGFWNYDDPLRLKNFSDQYLLLTASFMRNRRYFDDYLEDVREILQFSEEVKQNGSNVLRSLEKC
ncbi:unnamed protein product [Cylicostephanus goldi]|uniref:Uncharacterized protein n=1 Tax=Cylicostephanus goldi TaxID=71465 RepID=A0A3P6RTR1_CYLGO|nr:unnamed protein product [Cylicostephanus goldi]